MLKTLKLLLPVIFPSWRFFDIIAPSPRIEYCLLSSNNENATEWHELRPRPKHISPINFLKRLVWNPDWNESLFLMSCAERLTEQPTNHSINYIASHVLKAVKDQAAYTQFRLRHIYRIDSSIQDSISYVSPIYAVGEEQNL